jgi:cardiolipin synthase
MSQQRARVDSVWIVVCLFAALLAIAAIVAAYVTLSLNARANREDEIVSVPAISDGIDDFIAAICAAAGQPTTVGNTLEVLQNGAHIFPAMLTAIANATSSVHFVTFVYEAGRIPDTFANALCAAAARNVEVRVVIDRNGGEKIPPSLVERMRAAGCDVQWFRKATWYQWQEYNRRSHRRILVLDGRVGFTGGVGIADQWDGNGDEPHSWRDTHARIGGPAVAALQRGFVDSWNDATGELLLDAKYFPALQPAGDHTICVVQSSPANATSTAQRSTAALIASARRTLDITNPYVVPPPPFIDALRDAAARGVRVRILMPGPYHNKPSVRRASRNTWSALLAAGVHLYEHQVTMVHAKIIIVDGVACCLGSINFDPRSFALNAELAAITFDRQIADDLTRQLELDLTSSRAVQPSDVETRSLTARLLDRAAYVFRAQL